MKELYERYKGLLFSLAYQLTGSAMDAEDAVQDVFEKLYRNPELQEQPKAYLCRMVANRCLDMLKSARNRREQYTGIWLPEPLLTSETDEMEAVERHDLLSYAMLVLLERLSPAERAIFVLREGLGFDYKDIAVMVGKSEANCRKMMSRSRSKMELTDGLPDRSERADGEWAGRFLEALHLGKTELILSLLSEDVVAVSDGGGKVTAALRPIRTKDHVLQFLYGLLRNQHDIRYGLRFEIASVNGQAGVLVYDGSSLNSVVIPCVNGGMLSRLYIVRNPDKLAGLRFAQ